jgi:catechol 2,3-dioxygenase
MNILHLCDVMASSGYLNIERGPGRHGISNAFFLYIRDPDGRRLELYTSDYFTGDHDHAPADAVGLAHPALLVEQGSPFPEQAVREPQFAADVTVADWCGGFDIHSGNEHEFSRKMSNPSHENFILLVSVCF